MSKRHDKTEEKDALTWLKAVPTNMMKREVEDALARYVQRKQLKVSELHLKHKLTMLALVNDLKREGSRWKGLNKNHFRERNYPCIKACNGILRELKKRPNDVKDVVLASRGSKPPCNLDSDEKLSSSGTEVEDGHEYNISVTESESDGIWNAKPAEEIKSDMTMISTSGKASHGRAPVVVVDDSVALARCDANTRHVVHHDHDTVVSESPTPKFKDVTPKKSDRTMTMTTPIVDQPSAFAELVSKQGHD
jgi:hypothetical protein